MRAASDRRASPWVVLAVLALANVFNIVDRAMFGILVEPIRRDLMLSDTLLGLLSGFAFVLFYSVFGLPIARAMDRGSRTRILAGGIALWSVMTMACGLATGFGTLALARIGVGIGEATCFPAAMALIGDYFVPARRSQAIALFQSSNFVGIVGGAIAAGAIAASAGWRTAFVSLGLPGLVVAALVLLLIREPVRRHADADTPDQPFLAAVRSLLADRIFLLLVLAFAVCSTSIYVLSAWAPAFLSRVHDLGPAQVGAAIGPFVGVGGLVGTIGGGLLATRIARRRGRDTAGLIVPLIGGLLAIPALVTFVFAPSLMVALPAVGIGNMCLSTYLGPVVAFAVGRAPAAKRAIASAVLLIAQNLIGLGVGPLLTGVISDAAAPGAGPRLALRLGMLVAPASLAIATLFLLAARARLRVTEAG